MAKILRITDHEGNFLEFPIKQSRYRDEDVEYRRALIESWLDTFTEHKATLEILDRYKP